MLNRLTTSFSVHSLLVTSHVVVVGHRTLLVLVIHILVLPAQVGVVDAAAIAVLVRSLVDVLVHRAAVHVLVDGVRRRVGGWPSYR